VPAGEASFVPLILLGLTFCSMTLVWLTAYAGRGARGELPAEDGDQEGARSRHGHRARRPRPPPRGRALDRARGSRAG
jgi:hypothetical protein